MSLRPTKVVLLDRRRTKKNASLLRQNWRKTFPPSPPPPRSARIHRRKSARSSFLNARAPAIAVLGWISRGRRFRHRRSICFARPVLPELLPPLQINVGPIIITFWRRSRPNRPALAGADSSGRQSVSGGSAGLGTGCLRSRGMRLSIISDPQDSYR